MPNWLKGLKQKKMLDKDQLIEAARSYSRGKHAHCHIRVPEMINCSGSSKTWVELTAIHPSPFSILHALLYHGSAT